MADLPTIDSWWPTLNDDVRASFAADPGKALTADEVLEIARVRGAGPAGSRWVEGPEDYKFHLSGEDEDWIRANAQN